MILSRATHNIFLVALAWIAVMTVSIASFASDQSVHSTIPEDQVIEGIESLWKNFSWKNLKGRPYVADSSNPNAVYAYPANKKLQLNSRLLGLCMAYDLTRNPAGFDYNRSSSQCISPRDGRDVSHDPSVKKPPLVLYLSGDDERACDYASGKEDELKTWVLSQKDNSITPESIFAESIRLNKGEIFSSLITVYQLLRNNARWWDDFRYAYHSSKSDEERFFNKFIDIRGDLKERGKGFYGDHFGSWFRIWGTMIYTLGFVGETEFHDHLPNRPMCLKNLISPDFEADKMIADVGITIVSSWADEKAKQLQGGEEDGGKEVIDRDGSLTITWMLQGIWKPDTFRELRFSPERCTDSSYYLY